MNELKQAQRYLRERAIYPNSTVDAVESRGTSFKATYIGLLAAEHGVVAIVQVDGNEELRQMHYSRLLLRS